MCVSHEFVMTRHTYTRRRLMMTWFNRCPMMSCPLHFKSTNFKLYDQWKINLSIHIYTYMYINLYTYPYICKSITHIFAKFLYIWIPYLVVLILIHRVNFQYPFARKSVNCLSVRLLKTYLINDERHAREFIVPYDVCHIELSRKYPAIATKCVWRTIKQIRL